MDPNEIDAVAFGGVVRGGAALPPVPCNDFEELDGQQVFFPITDEEEAMAAVFFGDEEPPAKKPKAETSLPLRPAPSSCLPLAINGEIAVQNAVEVAAVEEIPAPTRRRLEPLKQNSFSEEVLRLSSSSPSSSPSSSSSSS